MSVAVNPIGAKEDEAAKAGMSALTDLLMSKLNKNKKEEKGCKCDDGTTSEACCKKEEKTPPTTTGGDASRVDRRMAALAGRTS